MCGTYFKIVLYFSFLTYSDTKVNANELKCTMNVFYRVSNKWNDVGKTSSSKFCL